MWIYLRAMVLKSSQALRALLMVNQYFSAKVMIEYYVTQGVLPFWEILCALVFQVIRFT